MMFFSAFELLIIPFIYDPQDDPHWREQEDLFVYLFDNFDR